MKRTLTTLVALCALVTAMTGCSSSGDAGGNVSLGELGVRLEHGSQPLLFQSRETPGAVAAVCDAPVVLKVAGAKGIELVNPPEGTTLDNGALSVQDGTSTLDLTFAVEGRRASINLTCLPPDFPTLTMKGTFTDWTVLQSIPIDRSIGSYRMVLDTSGFPVWFEPSKSTADVFFHDGALYRFMDGTNALTTVSEEPGVGFVKTDLDGRAAAEWFPATGPGLDHHDFAPLGNGHALGIVYRRGVEDLSSWGKIPAAPQLVARCPELPGSKRTPVLRGEIIELDESGTILHTWRPGDVLTAKSSPEWLNLAAQNAPANCMVDAEHLNGVSVDEASNTVIVTGRHLDGAVALRWPNGEVLWTLGSMSHPMALKIVGDPLSGPLRPHDAHLVGPDRLAMFDNRPGGRARMVVYTIDTAKRTATLTESYTPRCKAPLDCESEAMGSARYTSTGASVLLGMGTATTTAYELGVPRGDTLGSLVIGRSYAYRVTPLSPTDRASVTAQLAAR